MTAALRMPSSISALPYTQQLAAFKKNKPKCMFGNLQVTHHTFAASLERRVKKPWLINQASTYLCGPNAFFFCLASKAPDFYTKYVLELWTFGEARLGDMSVKPSRSCLDTRIKVRINTGSAEKMAFGIEPVDWVALASLRDSAMASLITTVCLMVQPASRYRRICGNGLITLFLVPSLVQLTL